MRLIDEKKYIKKSYLRKMAMCEPQYTMETKKDVETLMRLIEDAPLVDVAPVRHGRWVPFSYDGYTNGYPVYDEWECSECHFACEGEGEPPLNYCPYCGAKMEGKNEDGVD